MDCSTEGSVGDDDGDEEDAAFFRDHLSSRDLSATLVGLNSKKRNAEKNLGQMGSLRILKRCLYSNDLLSL